LTPTLTFTCSICGEASVSICVYCTKDACPNHLCERCARCSDCCECDIRLDEHPEHEPVHEEATPVVEPLVQALPVDGSAPKVAEPEVVSIEAPAAPAEASAAPEPAEPAAMTDTQAQPPAETGLPLETHGATSQGADPLESGSGPIDNRPQVDNLPHK
jgi:hypothetical protein